MTENVDNEILGQGDKERGRHGDMCAGQAACTVPRTKCDIEKREGDNRDRVIQRQGDTAAECSCLIHQASLLNQMTMCAGSGRLGS